MILFRAEIRVDEILQNQKKIQPDPSNHYVKCLTLVISQQYVSWLETVSLTTAKKTLFSTIVNLFGAEVRVAEIQHAAKI